MLPSGIYAEDENARTTLANGTVLKWTKKFNEIYGFGSETDLSITYCEWSSMDLTYARKTPNVWYNSCDAGLPDLGANESGVANDAAAGWTRSDGMAPKIDGIFSGVILTSPNNGKYYWGYDPMGSSTVAESGGQDTRILLDMDINKMLFSVTFTAVVLADLPNGNTAYSADPTGQHFPNTVTITLKELYNNPDKYGILDYSFGNCLVYGENTSDHWRIASIKPSFLIYKSNEMAGYLGTSPMGNCSGSIKMSFDTRYSNSHPTVSGGSLGAPIYQYGKSDGAYHYNMHFPPEFELKPNSTSYDLIGHDAILYYWQVYGTSTSGNHSVYVTANTIEVDDSIFWGVAEVGVKQTINPLKDEYTQLKWNWRHMYKGRYMLAYMAAFGLYFVNETYDPDEDNITPETLGDSDKIWLGEMSGNGMTTGTWITDLDSYHGPNKDGKTSNPDYKPGGGGGGSTDPWDVDPEIYGWGGNSVGGMVRYYLLTKTEMENLVSAMGSSANWVIDYLNNIVSCFVVPNNGLFFDAPVSTTIKFRVDNNTEWDTGVSCKRISGVKNKSGGTIEIPHCTNTFLDYEPYSDYSIYIPFCGRIPIKGNIVCGREITVTYYPDVPTCSVTAVVTCGDSTIGIAKGQYGSMLPVTSNGADRKTAATISDVSSIITGLGVGIAGAATGNDGLLIAGGSQLVGGLLNAAKDSVQSYAYSSGSSGDTSFFGAGTRCRYYANYLQLDDVVNTSEFGHTVGYLCKEIGQLNSFHGFTICANPHVNFSATNTEKEEIKQLLEQGVILP